MEVIEEEFSYESRIDIGGQLKQEDSINSMILSDGTRVFVVCDGHGIHGQLISNLVIESVNLTSFDLIDWPTLFDQLESIVFEEESNYHVNAVVLGRNIKSLKSHSGTTCSIIAIKDNVLKWAHVGDSDIVHVRGTDIRKISVNHSPLSRDEWERVQLCTGSKIEFQYACRPKCKSAKDRYIHPDKPLPVPVLQSNGQTIHWCYHKNVSDELGTVVHHTYNKLSMTRSLGDFWGKGLGLTSEPSFGEVRLEKDDILFVATDGFWDNWKLAELGVVTNMEQWFNETKQRGQDNFGDDQDNMAGFLIKIH